MTTPAQPETSPRAAARQGLYLVLWFGVVSLFADMAYEGARSIIGPYLATLGASGLVVGAVTGFGEFLGYGLRLGSGRWADRSRLYWPITLGGYVIQMIAVPMLALAGTWPGAAILVFLERTGKATRNPPRDVMLAQAGEHIGHGWAFGLSEGLDQLGALIGPLAIAALLAWQAGYSDAFAALAVPAVITLVLVTGARIRFPDAGRIVHEAESLDTGGYPRVYWIYCLGTALVAFGFADYSLIAYHLALAGEIKTSWIPVYYAVAMATAGLSSLVVGKLFDRMGLIVLVPITIVAALYAPFAFLGRPDLALAGIALWGIGLGAHESAMRAAVARMIPAQRRGSAYGVFGAAFGLAWFIGSAALGAAYDLSPLATAIVAVAAELLAVPPLIIAARMLGRAAKV